MAKRMVLNETELERLVRQLKDVTTRIDEIRGLFEEEDELRTQIREYMVENNIVRERVNDINLTIGTRKSTRVTDMEQLERTLQYRGVLEDCKVLDMGRVRKILGDDALGLETTEMKYLIVKDGTRD